MNLAFHHFKKEARCIRTRWLFWLGLLGVDLAMQLEWLLPMRGIENGPSVTYLVHQAVLWLALLLAVSGCPEDLPANDNAFVAVRPLPRLSYYLGRLLLIITLFVIPLAIQELLYLGISGRPWTRVLSGAGWRSLEAGAWLVWTVPAAALWKGWWQAACGVALLVTSLWLCDITTQTFFLGHLWIRDSAPFEPLTFLVTGWLIFGLCALLGWFNHHSRWSLPRRLVIVALLSPVLYLAMLTGNILARNIASGQDKARVKTLAAETRVSIPAETLRHAPSVSYQTKPARLLYGHIEAGGLPANIEMVARLRAVKTIQEGKAIPGYISQDDEAPRMYQSSPGFLPGALLSLLPRGTVLIPRSNSVYRVGGDSMEYEFGRQKNDVIDDTKPLEWQSEFDLTWLEWSQVAELPLQAGAQVRTGNAEFTLLEPRLNSWDWDAGSAGRDSGILSLRYRCHQAEDNAGLFLVLYSPRRHLAWCLGDVAVKSYDSTRSRRATQTSWQRTLGSFHPQDVLSYPDGEKADDVNELKLLVFERRQLGKSVWTWKSAPIDLRSHVPGHRDWYYEESGSTSLASNLEGLRKRLDSLSPPPAGASREQQNLYVLNVLKAYFALKTKAEQKAQYDLTVQKLKPFAQDHLDVILNLPSAAVAGPTNPAFRVAVQLANDTHRDLVVSRILDADWTAALVKAKGWEQYAKEKMGAAAMQRPRQEKHLRALMLTWDTPEVQQRQIHELQFFPDATAFESLYQKPDLRPQLDSLADQLEARLLPVGSWEGTGCDILEMAIARGKPEALELAFRWMSSAARRGGDYDTSPLEKMLTMVQRRTGLEPVPQDPLLPSARFLPFRHLHANQFDYLPDQRVWRKKP